MDAAAILFTFDFLLLTFFLRKTRHQSKLWNTPLARATYSDRFETTSIAKLRSIGAIVVNLKFAGKRQTVSPICVKHC